MNDALLDFSQLNVIYQTADGKPKYAVNDVALQIMPGEIVGLIGESGCGKTSVALALLGVLQGEPGLANLNLHAEVNGKRVDISPFDGDSSCPKTIRSGKFRRWQREAHNALASLRGEIFGVFQEPGASLNPYKTVADQIRECLRLKDNRDATGIKRWLANVKPLSIGKTDEEDEQIKDALSAAGFREAEAHRIFNEHPEALSVGMCQRVMLAMALAMDAKLLIADEPTTKLDTNTQKQVLQTLFALRQKGELPAMLLITHELGIMDAVKVDRVAVMYQGQIVEIGTRDEVFRGRCNHPYTRAPIGVRKPNQKSLVDAYESRRNALVQISPATDYRPDRCVFYAECAHPNKDDECLAARPLLAKHSDTHNIRCVKIGQK